MKHNPSNPNSRNARIFIASLLSYMLLASQLTPLALATNGSLRNAPATRKASEPQPTLHAAPAAPANMAPVPVPLLFVPNITATKTDNIPNTTPVNPGDIITYSITITNSGTDATNVTLNDTVDPNTTIIGASVKSTPIAFNDAYSVLGNVRIQVPDGASDLLANDVDPDTGTNAGLTITTLAGDNSAPFSGTSTQGGQVTATSGDGSFQYNPAPGFTGSDTFTYTVTDSDGGTSTATVTLTVAGMIWFVNAAAAGGGDGRITSPFNCLVGAGCFDPVAADDPGDNIFLYSGSYTGGLTLLNTQKLIGQGASDTLVNIAGVTAQPNGDPLPSTGGASPLITTGGAVNGINLGQGNTLRGFTVGNSGGAKIFGNTFGTLTAGNSTTPDLLLNGSGQALNLTNGTFAATSGFIGVTTTSSGTQGINLATIAGTVAFGSTTVSGSTTQCILIGTTTANINFGNTSCSGGTDGVSFQNNSAGTRTFGTLGVSGGSGNAFIHGAGGGNVTVNGAATLTSGGNPVDIQNSVAASINFLGGATVTKTTTGGAGVNLVAASVTFESLGITTSNGTGLSAITSGTITVTNGSKAISATGSAGQVAPAIIANSVTLNANFSNVSSTNSGGGGNGISLTNVGGTSNFGGGSISGAAGDAFFVSGGNGSVTYNGTIATSTAHPVNVAGKTGGTLAFGGAVSSTNNGVLLNSNTGATINFTGGLSLSTAANIAFAATAGGTVSATQNNTTIVNTLTTTTGTALNVANTIIGASGLTFRSISSNGGTSNGITLDNAGAGAFTVTGNGGAGTGGTIQNKNGADNQTTQGIGIYLNNVQNISLSFMSIQGCQNYGIRGNTVTGFTLDNSLVGTVAANGTSNVADTDPTGLSGEGSVRFYNLLGSATISNSTLDQGFSRTIALSNDTLTLNRLTITNCTVRQSLTAATASDSFYAQSNSNATLNFTITGASQFTATHQFHVQTSALGTSTMDIQINGACAFSNSINPVPAGGGLSLGGGGTDSLVTFNINGNSFRHGTGASPPGTNNVGRMLTAGMVSGAGKFDGKFTNNTVGVTGIARSGSGDGADAIGIFASGNRAGTIRGTGTLDSRFLVQGNTIKRYGETGILINARQGNSILDATVFGNTINEPGSAALGAFAGVWANSGALGGDTNTVNIVIGDKNVGANKNTMQDSDPLNSTDVFLENDSAAGATFNLFRNGSVLGTAAGVITDDNNPALDLVGFTSGTINLVNGTPPPPTAPVTIDVGPTEQPLAGTAKKETQQIKASASRVNTDPSIGLTSASSLTEEPLSVSAQSAERASTASDGVATSNPLDFNRANRQGGTIARYSAKDGWLSSASQHFASVQKQRGRITLPRPIGKGAANPPVIVGDNITWNIGTLPAGQSATITVQVQVDDPFTGPGQVSNQGLVTADGGVSILTDDPDAVGPANPTITLVTAPNIVVQDAKVAEPTSGTTNMLFNVVLSSPAGGSGVTVNYATADQAPGPGHAVAGSDYTATSGTLAFAAGQQMKTVAVQVLSDADNTEPDETFLLNLSGAIGGNITDNQAVGTITVLNPAGTFLISELRTSGPGGPGDDFVELYNNTGLDLTVAASDASAGYGVFKTGADCNATPVLIATIPNGTIIPARGHYLLVGPTYGLAAYAAGDQTVADIASDSNVAAFSTANVLNLSSANRLDAVGFGSNNIGVCALLQEGTNLQANGPSLLEHSFFRDPCGKGGDPAVFGPCPSGGKPVDTNNNATDFIFADTAATPTLAGQHLGAPGPENLASPIERNSTVATLLLDATKASSAIPNRFRDFTVVPNGANGTLSIRRRFVNNTGASITRLRFRVVDIDSTPVPGGIADVRALTSPLVIIFGVADPATCLASGAPSTPPCTVNVLGTTLETPPTQAMGGALNSSMITLGTPLANGASINLQFLLGVQTTGSFKFFVNVEALP